MQTLYASLVRRVDFGYDSRERIETPDGDFLDLDWAGGSPPSQNPGRAAVLVHGLEGNAARRYMRGMARILCRKEWDVCAINLRGCSGDMNRRIQTYHSGKTDDLALVIRHVLSMEYDTVALVGFSLGGNIVLKYLGDRSSEVDNRVRGAAAISVPIDLASSSRKIGRLSNWHYTQYFLYSLRRKVRAKANQYPERIDAERLEGVSTLWDFDDAFTAPIHGFRSATDYYRRASSKPVLADITVPTLLLNARNDPFLPRSCYPGDIARRNPYLALETPESGGHVGFVSHNEKNAYYSERRAANVLDRYCSPESRPAPEA